MVLQYKIATNKFSPPQIDSTQSLFRKQLIVGLLAKDLGTNHIVSIIAQAGQGKTTLALQFLEYHNLHYAWYQIGHEDHDPVQMFASLLQCLMMTTPQFEPVAIVALVNDGDLSLDNLYHITGMFLTELSLAAKEDIYIVLDDLHLLHDNPSMALLEFLLSFSTSHVKFLLLSRQPLALSSGPPTGRNILEIKENAMSLSVTESMELLNQIHELDIPWAKVKEIHKLTEGWIMGQVMIASAIRENRAAIDNIKTIALKSGLNSYLKNEIFTHLPDTLSANFIKLSLLDEIEIPLAIELTGDPQISENIHRLDQCNYFLRELDNESKTFRLHHLCRDFLREKAPEVLGPECVTETLKTTAEYYLKKEMLGTALAYYNQAGAYTELEQILEEQGMDLVAMNRAVTVLSLLESIPAHIRPEMAWINLLAGIVSIQMAPATCQALLETALDLFIKNGNRRGELLATSELICVHWVSTGAFSDAAALLPRAEELYHELADNLTVYDQILVCSNISCGFSVFICDMDKARFYSYEAMNLAVLHDKKNFIATILFIQGYASYFSDQLPLTTQDIEKAQSLLIDPHVGLFNRIALMALQIDLLAEKGDYRNYQRQEGLLIEPLGQEMIEQTVLGAFLPIWRTSLAISQGQFSEAVEEITRGHASGIPCQNPHLRSFLLQWQAYALALVGKKEEARIAADESLALRKATGGPYFVAYNSLIIGIVFLHIGSHDEAEKLLVETIELADKLGHKYFVGAALLQLAYLNFERPDRTEEGSDYLRRGLQLLRNKKRTYCWGIPPQFLKKLLSKAIELKTEVDWAKKIAEKRLTAAILDNGELIPMLDIKILGNFSISIDKNIVGKAEDLPPAQRQLIAMIIAAPEQKIGQEQIQLLFWPNSPPDKARAALDALLKRLRKSVSAMIKPLKLNNYLTLKKGVICLERCKIDAVDFKNLVTAGLQHSRRRESWQAGNHFYLAMKLWKGCFASDIFPSDQIQEHCYELRRLLVKAAITWGKILSQMGRISEAIEIVEKAFVYEPSNTELVKMLYTLHMTDNNAPQAKQVIDRYENILRLEEYDPREITDMLEQIFTL